MQKTKIQIRNEEKGKTSSSADKKLEFVVKQVKSTFQPDTKIVHPEFRIIGQDETPVVVAPLYGQNPPDKNTF